MENIVVERPRRLTARLFVQGAGEEDVASIIASWLPGRIRRTVVNGRRTWVVEDETMRLAVARNPHSDPDRHRDAAGFWHYTVIVDVSLANRGAPEHEAAVTADLLGHLWGLGLWAVAAADHHALLPREGGVAGGIGLREAMPALLPEQDPPSATKVIGPAIGAAAVGVPLALFLLLWIGLESLGEDGDPPAGWFVGPLGVGLLLTCAISGAVAVRQRLRAWIGVLAGAGAFVALAGALRGAGIGDASRLTSS